MNPLLFSNRTVRRLWSGLLVATLLLFSCSSNTPFEPAGTIDLAAEWQVAAPESQDLDPAQIARAFDLAEQNLALKSLLVARNGVLVGEEYFRDNHREDLYHMRSVTKSVVSTLIGIAIEKGFISSKQTKISDLLNMAFVELNGGTREITLEHLLTMTAGFEWSENSGPDFGQWIRSNDQINYVLGKPLINSPGATFTYNTGASHLLSVILAEATGMSTQDFADQFLFKPLGVTSRRWDADGRGYFYGGHGLQLRPRDMARLGLLFLQEGFSDSEAIVPRDWVRRATETQVSLGFSYGALQSIDYGYLWWLENSAVLNAFIAWGWGGQFIFCVPADNLVVVTTAEWLVSSAQATKQAQDIFALIVNEILPSVR